MVLFFVSGAKFFHFILGHNFSIIDEWMSVNAWSIVAISKIIPCFLIMKFIGKDYLIDAFKVNMNLFNKRVINREIITIILFTLFSTIILGKPFDYVNSDRSLSYMAKSFIGSAIFLISDLFIIFCLNKITSKLDSYYDTLIIAIFISALSYLFINVTFLYASNILSVPVL